MNEHFFGTPLIASQHGAALDRLTWLVHGLMLLLFIGWLAYFIYVLFRFRKSRNPKASHTGVQNHLSTWVEVGVATIEAVLLIGFAVPLWAKAVDEFPQEKDSVVIRVTGRQFNWIAHYPGADGQFGDQDTKFVANNNPTGINRTGKGKDDVLNKVSSEVAVPVGKDVIIHLGSLDVIHSFKLNSMRVTQDAIPGMNIPLHFKPIKEGKYQINCAQLCGVGHSSMMGLLKVLSPAEFDKWLKANAGEESFE